VAYKKGKGIGPALLSVVTLLALTAGVAGAAQRGTTATSSSTSSVGATLTAHDLSHPTKALCKSGKTYKIGYEVFSSSQPFAVSVSDSLVAAAKAIGCATVITEVDNMNGPQAIANVKTEINEGINLFVDFQVLAPYQQAIANLLKAHHIPAVTIVGALLPGFPSLGLSPFQGEEKAMLAQAAFVKAKYPGSQPYFVGGAEPESGAAVLARFEGAKAGFEKAFPGLPASHVIEVDTNGTQSTAYSVAKQAASRIPAGSVVMTQAVNDEDTAGVWQGVTAHGGFKAVIAESFGGDSYGMSQVCKNPKTYAGAWDLEPQTWGPTALSLVMEQANGLKVPATTSILGVQATKANGLAGCK
jgi:ABC-type sugar transport system substrate-binding protein